MNAYSLSDLSVGLRESIEVDVTPADIDRFCELSGDVSPLHVDEAFARSRGYRGRVAHGFFTGALVSRLIGTRLPGRNGVLMQAEMSFRNALVPPDRVTVGGVVTRISEATGQVTIEVSVTSQTGTLLSTGLIKTIVRSP